MSETTWIKVQKGRGQGKKEEWTEQSERKKHPPDVAFGVLQLKPLNLHSMSSLPHLRGGFIKYWCLLHELVKKSQRQLMGPKLPTLA